MDHTLPPSQTSSLACSFLSTTKSKTIDTTTTKRKLASAWLYGGKHMQDASLEMMGDQALHKDVSIKPELDNMLTF